MAIVMTSGGVSKTYQYYPYDAFYVNGQRVREAWFNGVKYYPEQYPKGIVALRGIETHPVGVSHPIPDARYARCSEVYSDNTLMEIAQYAIGSYEISWAYLGILEYGSLNDVVIQSPTGGLYVSPGESVGGGPIDYDQYIFRIKYMPNRVLRSELSPDSRLIFDAILNGYVISTGLIYRNRGDAWVDDKTEFIVSPGYTNYTEFKIIVRLNLSNGLYIWRVFFQVSSILQNGTYNQGHGRFVELFRPNNSSLLTDSDLLPLSS